MFKKTLANTFLIVSLLIARHVFAAFPDTSEIITINSMREVEHYADKHTFVLFDLDHTVLEGKTYGYGHTNWFYDQLEKAKIKGIDEKKVIDNIHPHWVYSQKNSSIKPVEELTPALIKTLQAKGILVMAITSREVSFAELTYNQLDSIGVNFNSTQLPTDAINIALNAPTLMERGIIFCSNFNEKGTVLHAYLDKLNMTPKKIIIVDDSMKHLHSVINAYSQEATVLGLYYPLVADYKKQHWNAKLAHQEYYNVYLKTPELHDFPLELE